MIHKILIIDAHPVYAPRIEGFLRGLTFHDVRIVRAGEEAIAAIPEFLPDAVIISSMLPDMDAADCCARVRAAHSKVSIIVQTGLFTELTQEEQLRRSGADAIIPRREKDLQPLQQALEKLLDLPVHPE